MGPVEESWFAPSAEHQHEENELHLQSKLQEEANYHLFGSRMDRRTKEQAGGSAAYGGEEERRRRVSHDPFAQQRPHEPAQSPAVKGLACAGPGSAAQHPAGLSSHPQPLYQSHGSHKPQGLGARPLDLGAADRRVWYMPSQGHRPSLYKTPVPETDLLGNTPTVPFASLPSRGKQAFPSCPCTFYIFLKVKVPSHQGARLSAPTQAPLPAPAACGSAGSRGTSRLEPLWAALATTERPPSDGPAQVCPWVGATAAAPRAGRQSCT